MGCCSDGQADATNEISTSLSLDRSMFHSQRRKWKKQLNKCTYWKYFKNLSGNKRQKWGWNKSKEARRNYVDEVGEGCLKQKGSVTTDLIFWDVMGNQSFKDYWWVSCTEFSYFLLGISAGFPMTTENEVKWKNTSDTRNIYLWVCSSTALRFKSVWVFTAALQRGSKWYDFSVVQEKWH